MSIKAISFSSPMVKAIIDGRKTEMRRCVPQKYLFMADTDQHDDSYFRWEDMYGNWYKGEDLSPWSVGDILWVREPAKVISVDDSGVDGMTLEIQYAADGETRCVEVPSRLDKLWLTKYTEGWPVPEWVSKCKNIPNGVFKEAARFFLRVESIGVDRLQNVKEKDAWAEGLSCLTKDGGRTYKYGIADADGWPGNGKPGWPWADWETDPRKAFSKLWDSIAKPGRKWVDNPYVWVVKFEQIGKPKGWG